VRKLSCVAASAAGGLLRVLFIWISLLSASTDAWQSRWRLLCLVHELTIPDIVLKEGALPPPGFSTVHNYGIGCVCKRGTWDRHAGQSHQNANDIVV